MLLTAFLISLLMGDLQHMSAKHPPTFDCLECTKTFASPGALSDHFRGSVKHPNCVKCGKGFKNFAERKDVRISDTQVLVTNPSLQHQALVHVPIPCGPCGGILVDRDAQDGHYLASPNHPNCLLCNHGFEDQSRYTHVSQFMLLKFHDPEISISTSIQSTRRTFTRRTYSEIQILI